MVNSGDCGMSGIACTPAAIADISEIWDNTAGRWGVDRADRYADDIRDACDGLAEGRKRGRPEDVRDGYLKYAVGRHNVVFVSAAEAITDISVLNQSMDTERHLQL